MWVSLLEDNGLGQKTQIAKWTVASGCATNPQVSFVNFKTEIIIMKACYDYSSFAFSFPFKTNVRMIFPEAVCIWFNFTTQRKNLRKILHLTSVKTKQIYPSDSWLLQTKSKKKVMKPWKYINETKSHNILILWHQIRILNV